MKKRSLALLPMVLLLTAGLVGAQPPARPADARNTADLFAGAADMARLGDLLRAASSLAEAQTAAEFVATVARERRRDQRPGHNLLLRSAASVLGAHGDRDGAARLLDEVRAAPERDYDWVAATIELAALFRSSDAPRAEALYREALAAAEGDWRRLRLSGERAGKDLASLLRQHSRHADALAVRRWLLERTDPEDLLRRDSLLREIAVDLDELGLKEEAAAARAEAIRLLQGVEGTSWSVVARMMERARARAGRDINTDGDEEAYARELRLIYDDPAVRFSDWAIFVGLQLSVSLSRTQRHAEARALREELAMVVLAREAELDAAAASQSSGVLERAMRSVLLDVGSSITPSEPEREPLLRAAGEAFLRRYAGDSPEDAIARRSVLSAMDIRAQRATRHTR